MQGTVNTEAGGDVLICSASLPWTWRAETLLLSGPKMENVRTETVIKSLLGNGLLLYLQVALCLRRSSSVEGREHTPPPPQVLPHLRKDSTAHGAGCVYGQAGYKAGYESGTGSGGLGCPLAGTTGSPLCRCLTY